VLLDRHLLAEAHYEGKSVHAIGEGTELSDEALLGLWAQPFIATRRQLFPPPERPAVLLRRPPTLVR